MADLDEKMEKLRVQLMSDPIKRKKFFADAIKTLEEHGVELDQSDKDKILKDAEKASSDDPEGSFQMAKTAVIITVLNKLA